MDKQITEVEVDSPVGIHSKPLLAFLNACASVEQRNTIIRATDVLREFGLPDKEFEAEELAMLVNTANYEAHDLLVNILGVYENGLAIVLSHHGVWVDDDTSLVKLVDIVEGLAELPYSELSNDFVRILESLEPNEVKLASLLELVGNKSAERYLESIWNVDDKLMIGIQAVHVKALALVDTGVSLTTIAAARKRVKQYHEMLGTTNTRLWRLLASGLAPSLPFNTYMERFKDLFVTLPDSNAGVELFGFFLCSQDFELVPMTLLDPHLESLFGDAVRSQDVRRIVQNVMMRYTNYRKQTP